MLIGHWKLNGDINDYSGNGYHGANSTVTNFDESFLGQAPSFTDSGEYIEIPHSQELSEKVFGNSQLFSMSAWFNITSWPNYGAIINKANAGSWSNTTAGIWTYSGGVRFIAGSNESGNPSGSTTAITRKPSSGDWHHVSGVADGTYLRMYIDGNLIGTTSFSNIKRTRSENTAPIIIGPRRIGYDEGVYGRVSDIRIYDHALSERDIYMLANNPILSKLQEREINKQRAYYFGFSENSSIRTIDSDSPQRHNILFDSNKPSWQHDDRFGGNYRFDGNQYIEVPSYGEINGGIEGNKYQEITGMTWFKVDDSTRQNFLLEKQWDGGDGDWGLSTYDEGLRFYAEKRGHIQDYRLDAGSISSNTWHHAAFTLKTAENRVQMYLDGQLIVDDTASDEISASTNGHFYIGSRFYENDTTTPTTSASLIGNIADVRIYTKVLSHSEILEEMNRQISIDKTGNLITNRVFYPGITNPLILDYREWNQTIDGNLDSSDGYIWDLNGAVEENDIIYSDDPFGRRTNVWRCLPNSSSGPDGGFNKRFNIDHTKTHRYSIFVRRTGDTNGSTYLGCDNGGVTRNLSGSTNNNPYFWNGDPPNIGDWYLIVGVVHHSGYGTSQTGISGVYDMNGNQVITGTDYKCDTSGIQEMRAYLYYCTNTDNRQYFVYPRVDIMDGNEPSIKEIISGLDSYENTDLIKGIGLNSNITKKHNNGIVANFPLDRGLEDVHSKFNAINHSASINLSEKSIEFVKNAGQWIELPNSIFNNLEDFTISSWIKLKSINSSWSTLLSVATESNTNTIIFGFVDGDLSFHYRGIESNHISNSSVSTDKWYHVALTRSGSIFKMYLDSQEIYSVSLNSDLIKADGVVIGQEQDSVLGGFVDNQDFNGFVKNFLVFNRALDKNDINNIIKLNNDNGKVFIDKENKFYTKGRIY